MQKHLTPTEAKLLRRDQYLRDAYGFSLPAYETMLAAQGNACAICDTPRYVEKLVVDGNRDTRQVFGILCLRCFSCVRAEREYLLHPADLKDSVLEYLSNSWKPHPF